jgi:hypothetical protein
VEDLPWDQGATPASVLEAGRWTDQQKLPTVVASGTCSWETREVVFDESRGGTFLLTKCQLRWYMVRRL